MAADAGEQQDGLLAGEDGADTAASPAAERDPGVTVPGGGAWDMDAASGGLDQEDTYRRYMTSLIPCLISHQFIG